MRRKRLFIVVVVVAGPEASGPARREGLTQPLLAHAHDVAASVRPTLGCALIYGVTDVFVVRDGLP